MIVGRSVQKSPETSCTFSIIVMCHKRKVGRLYAAAGPLTSPLPKFMSKSISIVKFEILALPAFNKSNMSQKEDRKVVCCCWSSDQSST